MKQRTRSRLSELLNLPVTGSEQDWDIELRDSERIGEFIDLYESGRLDNDERIELMELIIASYDELLIKKGTPDERWIAIVKLIKQDRDIHKPTLDYWSAWTANNPEDWFQITPLVRALNKP